MSDMEWWEEAPYPLLDQSDSDDCADRAAEQSGDDPLRFTYLENPKPFIDWGDSDD